MHTSLRLALVIGAIVVLAGSSAHARIPIPVHSGPDIVKVGPIPQELVAAAEDPTELGSWELGWKYSSFGALFSDVWTWDRELVFVKENTYTDIPAEIRTPLEKKYPFSKCGRGIWRKVGAKAIAVLILLGLLMQLKETITGRSS
jgi:hypothetical protein